MIRTFVRAFAAVTLIGSFGCGCSQLLGEPPTYSFALTIRVVSDDGSPISGAEIAAGASRRLATDRDGRATLEVVGREGDRRSFAVRCPAQFQSPAQPLVVSLHRSAAGAKDAIYTAICVPLKRTVVVAVRFEGGPGFPVQYLDTEVARTDESGAAHFLVQAVPGEPFRVTIKTRELDEDLRPVDPSAELSVGAADDIVVFDQRMSRVTKRVARPARARRVLPTRL